MFRSSGFCLLFGVGLLLTFAAYAAETGKVSGSWPQWRGPHRDGVSEEKGLLKEWGPEGPPLAWKASGIGEGFASVSVADGRVFTMGERDKAEFVIALDGNDGKELWATLVGGPFEASGRGPRSTPTVDGKLLYAVGPLGDLVCLEVETGKEVWRKNFVKEFGGRRPHWGYSESPLIDGDRLICSPCGEQATIVALNKSNGEVIWKCPVPNLGNGAGYSSIVISEAGGVREYVQLLGQGCGCVGVEAKDGKLLWSYGRVGNGTASIPTPIVKGDFVFCSSGYGTGAVLLKLSPKDGGITAEEVYYLNGDKFQNHHGGMILIGDYIYAGHGHNKGFPTCLDMKTGNVVWGGKDNKGPGNGSAAVVYADGELYFRYDDGTVALIEATPEGYKVHGTFKVPNEGHKSWPHPVVAGGKLYLREQNNLFVFQLASK